MLAGGLEDPGLLLVSDDEAVVVGDVCLVRILVTRAALPMLLQEARYYVHGFLDTLTTLKTKPEIQPCLTFKPNDKIPFIGFPAEIVPIPGKK